VGRSVGPVTQSTQPLIVGQSRRDDYLFQRLAHDTIDELVADPPFRTVSEPAPVSFIPLGRRLTTTGGAFAGAVVGTFAPTALRDLSSRCRRRRRCALYHRSGALVLREPSARQRDR